MPETPSASPAHETVPAKAVTSLICGSQADCLSKICASPEKCPLRIALSNQAIFDFVATYSECEECKTPGFSPDKGIGKCVEYRIANRRQTWTVIFWVSENCKFRHSDPTRAIISVAVDKEMAAIETVVPDIAYIEDPSYCSIDSDCKGLSGSGAPLIGCRNFFYAPLNWSGYYAQANNLCVCAANQCQQK